MHRVEVTFCGLCAFVRNKQKKEESSNAIVALINQPSNDNDGPHKPQILFKRDLLVPSDNPIQKPNVDYAPASDNRYSVNLENETEVHLAQEIEANPFVDATDERYEREDIALIEMAELIRSARSTERAILQPDKDKKLISSLIHLRFGELRVSQASKCGFYNSVQKRSSVSESELYRIATKVTLYLTLERFVQIGEQKVIQFLISKKNDQGILQNHVLNLKTSTDKATRLEISNLCDYDSSMPEPDAAFDVKHFYKLSKRSVEPSEQRVPFRQDDCSEKEERESGTEVYVRPDLASCPPVGMYRK
ncbi:MAG: hypothetical protein AAF772_01025 [Acidobacteriota bacterium]